MCVFLLELYPFPSLGDLSARCHCNFPLPVQEFAVVLFSMSKISVAEFFQRAREKGAKENKEIVNNEEVKKELQPGTKRNSRRALALWQQ